MTAFLIIAGTLLYLVVGALVIGALNRYLMQGGRISGSSWFFFSVFWPLMTIVGLFAGIAMVVIAIKPPRFVTAFRKWAESKPQPKRPPDITAL